MKLEAKVNVKIAGSTPETKIVLVDGDYIDGTREDITEYVVNELHDILGHVLRPDEFEIENIDELITELAYDEFDEKTQYRNA